ncbi:hypothetical protein Vi05172_g12026 [Venturia inaequalis]|nr:hypothetical protein Vi05172_g12026 [Venturia inaequalis]
MLPPDDVKWIYVAASFPYILSDRPGFYVASVFSSHARILMHKMFRPVDMPLLVELLRRLSVELLRRLSVIDRRDAKLRAVGGYKGGWKAEEMREGGGRKEIWFIKSVGGIEGRLVVKVE